MSLYSVDDFAYLGGKILDTGTTGSHDAIREQLKGLFSSTPTLWVYGRQYTRKIGFDDYLIPLSDVEELLCPYYDVQEVLFQRPGQEAFPLHQHDLVSPGAYCAKFQKKEELTTCPPLVGLMNIRGEADVLQDVLDAYAKDFTAIYALDGNDIDDHSQETILAGHPLVKRFWRRHGISWPDDDSIRQVLLEEARKDFGSQTFWIFSTQGDEIYHTPVQPYVVAAMGQNATHLGTQVATFLLHPDEKDAPSIWALRHYIWGGAEFSGCLHRPWLYYQRGEHVRSHPHFIWPNRFFTYRLIRQHYPFRNQSQATARIRDRLERGYQPQCSQYEAVFYEHEWNGLPIHRYHGWLERDDTMPGGSHA